jgi:hypothetical protein
MKRETSNTAECDQQCMSSFSILEDLEKGARENSNMEQSDQPVSSFSILDLCEWECDDTNSLHKPKKLSVRRAMGIKFHGKGAGQPHQSADSGQQKYQPDPFLSRTMNHNSKDSGHQQLKRKSRFVPSRCGERGNQADVLKQDLTTTKSGLPEKKCTADKFAPNQPQVTNRIMFTEISTNHRIRDDCTAEHEEDDFGADETCTIREESLAAVETGQQTFGIEVVPSTNSRYPIYSLEVDDGAGKTHVSTGQQRSELEYAHSATIQNFSPAQHQEENVGVGETPDSLPSAKKEEPKVIYRNLS